MGKAPAFQFYPGDWMQDTRVLSLAAKGAWIDLLCAMWRSQTRGKLSLPWVGYARLIGASVEQTKAAIGELIDMQICDYDTDGNADCNGNVTLINRRMLREERERELTRCRVERHRNADVKRDCNGISNAKVTPPSSTSSSTSTSKHKTHRASFVVPTVDEVAAYCRERMNKINPQVWIDHYTSNGWMVGKNRMKDWKAAVRTWEARDNNNGSKPQGPKLKKISELPDLDKQWEERSMQHVDGN